MRYSVIILFFGILSAQWTGRSASLIDSGRKYEMTRGNFQKILSVAGQPEEMEMQR